MLVSDNLLPGQADDPLAFEQRGVVPVPIGEKSLLARVPLTSVDLDDEIVGRVIEIQTVALFPFNHYLTLGQAERCLPQDPYY